MESLYEAEKQDCFKVNPTLISLDENDLIEYIGTRSKG